MAINSKADVARFESATEEVRQRLNPGWEEQRELHRAWLNRAEGIASAKVRWALKRGEFHVEQIKLAAGAGSEHGS